MCTFRKNIFPESFFYASFSDGEQNQLGLSFIFFRWHNRNCILLVLPFILTFWGNLLPFERKSVFFLTVMDIEVDKLGLGSEKILGEVAETAFFVPIGEKSEENLFEKLGSFKTFWTRSEKFLALFRNLGSQNYILSARKKFFGIKNILKNFQFFFTFFRPWAKKFRRFAKKFQPGWRNCFLGVHGNVFLRAIVFWKLYFFKNFSHWATKICTFSKEIAPVLVKIAYYVSTWKFSWYIFSSKSFSQFRTLSKKFKPFP